MSCKTSLVPLSRAADVRSLSLSSTDQCGGVRIMQWFWSHLTKTHFWIIFCRMFRIWWYYIKKSVHTVWSPLSFLFYPEMKCRILNHKSSIKCLTPPPISRHCGRQQCTLLMGWKQHIQKMLWSYKYLAHLNPEMPLTSTLLWNYLQWQFLGNKWPSLVPNICFALLKLL